MSKQYNKYIKERYFSIKRDAKEITKIYLQFALIISFEARFD